MSSFDIGEEKKCILPSLPTAKEKAEFTQEEPATSRDDLEKASNLLIPIFTLMISNGCFQNDISH